MRIKQAVCYPMLGRYVPLEDLFRACTEIGFAGVEGWAFGDDFERVAELATKYHLNIATMVGHQSIVEGLNKRSNHDRIEHELRMSINLAARYGVSGLTCYSGNHQPFVTAIEAIEATADGLRRIAPYAERQGVNLNLELLNSKVDHPGYQCDHTAWGVAVCERVNSPRVKLVYDIYHMQLMEGDVIRTIGANTRWIGDIHTAGAPGRHELGDTQELNYAGICHAIASTDYDLYVAHEFRPTGDAIVALQEAFALCDRG